MYVAIDVGGTKILVATLDNNGVIQQRLKFPTPKNYDVFIRKLTDTVAYLSTKDIIAAGIGIPGRIDRKRGLGVGMGNLNWKNVPIEKDVKKILHAPTIVENDAKLAGLSEAMLLKDKYNKVLYITLGTGIGTALIVNQEIDPNYADAEGGKILLEHKGKLQEWEDFASGRAIMRIFGKPAREITSERDWKAIAHNICLGLIDMIAIFQPEVIVIGGGIGRYFEHYGPYLKKELKKYETPLIPIPPIREAQRPDDAVLYGCYDLAKSRYGTSHT
jgi:predicted NBD/HSP70 family sugar kinase